MDDSWDFHLLGLVVGTDLLHLLYLPIKTFAAIILKSSNDMSLPILCKQYDCLQMQHLSDQKAFSSKSDTCFYDRVCNQLFFIRYIYTTHANDV